MRWQRLAPLAIVDAGMILAVLTFVVRLDSTVRLIATILLVAGLLLILWGASLKDSEGQQAHRSNPDGQPGRSLP